MFSPASVVFHVCYDVHLSHLNKDYLLTYLINYLLTLFDDRITQNVLKRFSQNSVERWHMGRRRNDLIFMVMLITLC